MTDIDRDPVRLKNIFYVPGPARILFYVSQFAQSNNTAEIMKNFVYLAFIDRKITCPILSATREALNTTIAQKKPVTITRNKLVNGRPVPLDTLHRQFGHRHSNTIMCALEHILWADAIATIAPESLCDSCNIIITKKYTKQVPIC
jgi:hypothetical protein